MKQVLYACRNSKNAVRGLNFLLSNENIELRGCLIPDRCENVREICEKNDINIYDDKTRDKINEDFEESSIDLLISFSYPKKIDDYILGKTKCAINYHPAPLPEYKGNACACHGLYNGETYWGGTFHIMTSEFDRGPIIEKRKFEITPDLQYGILLSDATWDLGYEMLKHLVNEYVKIGSLTSVEQQQTGKFYKRKDLNRARKIYETDSPEEIERKIKAFWFPPYEGAYIEKDGEHFSVITNEMLMEIAEKMNNNK